MRELRLTLLIAGIILFTSGCAPPLPPGWSTEPDLGTFAAQTPGTGPPANQNGSISSGGASVEPTGTADTEPGVNSSGSGDSSAGNGSSGNNGATISPTPEPNMDAWITYRNEDYAFSIRYAPIYLPVVRSNPAAQPALLAEVIFKDQTAGNSVLADRGPFPFAIAVYNNANHEGVEQWLRRNGILTDSARFTVESVTVSGVPGLRLTSPALIAPRTFIYVAQGSFIYAFTPLGAFADQMLSTVTFTQ